MKRIFISAIILCTMIQAQAQSFNFTFGQKSKTATNITAADSFSVAKGYGYDFINIPRKAATPFYFSVNVPDGNYKVTVRLGSKKAKASTSVRAESRRLFVENVATKKGEFKEFSFVVNKRDTKISDGSAVKIKPREKNKLNWDDKLTIEFNGDAPAVSEMKIERIDNVPTVYLIGNSTVVDQDFEPWASWGQMITRWFDDGISFANYAESGERASSFIGANRFKKIHSLLKNGDYVFIEFGHNDQKEKGPGKGAYYNFSTHLKEMTDMARAKGATVIFVTPTQRRSFDKNGKIKETHGDYPDAMRAVAKRENVQVIELHDMTRTFYETMGVENSKKAFVHYKKGSFPGMDKDMEDNTHFNPYGAYELAKCIIEGMKQLNLPLLKNLREDYKPFNPAQPDDVSTFKWNNSPFIDVQKPDGN